MQFKARGRPLSFGLMGGDRCSGSVGEGSCEVLWPGRFSFIRTQEDRAIGRRLGGCPAHIAIRCFSSFPFKHLDHREQGWKETHWCAFPAHSRCVGALPQTLTRLSSDIVFLKKIFGGGLGLIWLPACFRCQSLAAGCHPCF